VERNEKMNRLLLFLFVLWSSVIVIDPAFARGTMRDLGAAGSLDQGYQTDILPEEAPPDVGRESGRRNSGKNPDGPETGMQTDEAPK
jgi:hypothetical protein